MLSEGKLKVTEMLCPLAECFRCRSS